VTFVGLIGIILSLVALRWCSVRLTPNRALLFLALLAVHLAATTAMYLYVQDNTADSTGYYFDAAGMVRWDFKLGTVFVVKLVQYLKGVIGGSYLDYFLIFQAFGVWGLALMMRIFQEAELRIGAPFSTGTYALLFLPSLHFWTSSIGKDAPLFFAVTLAVWSVMRLRTRFLYYAVAMGVMILFRPHIALIATIGLAAAAAFGQGTSLPAKLGVLVLAVAGTFYISQTVENTFYIQLNSAESVMDWFAQKSEIGQQFAGGTAVHGASFPVRLISLLFRPLFFDANGAFAIVASFENLLMLFIAGFFAANWRDVLGLARTSLVLRFCWFFALALTILLAVVYYNVGLGLRQRTMIMPALLTIFAVQWTRFRLMRQQTRAAARPEWPVAQASQQ